VSPVAGLLSRRPWLARVAAFAGLGASGGAAAWALGPRLALAVAVGLGLAGGLTMLDYLRRAHHRLTAAHRRDLAALGERMHGELAAVQRRARDHAVGLDERHRADLDAVEQRLRAALDDALAASERRQRTASSGELAALEKRLRTGDMDRLPRQRSAPDAPKPARGG
jgi:hypothetical protein